MGSDRVYSVEIAVQPPSVAKTGVPLYPPAVVRVHTYDSDGNEITGEDEMSSMFAQATLWRESGNPPSLAPPDMYLLSGRLSMSLDLLNDAIATEGCNGVSPSTALHRQQGSYAMFPDLTINRPGRYKLGISVFKVGDGSRVRSSISAGSSDGASRGGGVSLEEAKSIVISVEDDALPSSRPGRISE
ncbi:hypothetical protein EDC01DRAFT_718944 [Geopyxis carbonaria]|nr:hypothetical protein EDC01DRAFT_718944 [Geopyxis carbonaria]